MGAGRDPRWPPGASMLLGLLAAIAGWILFALWLRSRLWPSH